ncbi:MAG: cell surface protein SprA, partial [Methanobacteriota archaeon]
MDPDSAWAGIMRSTASFPNQEQTRFIEMWVKGDNGQINIDIGRISEDYWVRGEFLDPVTKSMIPSLFNMNTEDQNLNGLLDVEDGEDTGIDGVAGKDGSNVPGDAGDDDWAEPRATRPFFSRINGTEGNSEARGARYPDTEDLDGDGIVNLFNDYFEYSFDLSDHTTEFLVDSTSFPDGTPTGWKLYRIPLRDFTFAVGNPDTNFQQIFYFRIWMNNLKPKPGEYDSVQIATIDFVGNEWEEDGIALTDTSGFVIDEDKFGIAVINTEESNIYQSPPGVTGIRDRITRVLSKEQSLVMDLIDLPPGARVEARKQLRNKINLINYKHLKMFVHGDEKLTESDSLIFYIRFGPTEKIFYEYSERVYPGWAERNKIDIDFAELAKTKDDAYLLTDSINGVQVHYREDPNHPGKFFKVVGKPGLHNINYFVIGARNAGSTELREMQIWLDELRVTGVERESGTAMRLFTELGVADIANVRAQWELIDDNFRRIENQFASNDGKDRTQEKQSYFASMKLNKFLPESWGLEIPIDAKYTRTRTVPKYFYNSDRPTNYQIKGFGERLKTFFGLRDIPSELADQINFSETRSIGGTFKRRDRQRDPWYLRYTLNQLVVDADYSEKQAFSPTLETDESSSFSGRLSYQIPFGKKNYFKPFGWLGSGKLINFLSGMKLYYLPSSANMSMTLNENESFKKNRLETEAPPPSISVKTTRKLGLSYKLTDNISFDFSRDYQSDAFLKGYRAKDALEAIFTKFDFGVDRRISQRFGTNVSPKLFSWLNTNYRYASNFVYSFDNPEINDRSSTLNKNHNIQLDFKPSTLIN